MNNFLEEAEPHQQFKPDQGGEILYVTGSDSHDGDLGKRFPKNHEIVPPIADTAIPRIHIIPYGQPAGINGGDKSKRR